MEWKPFRVEWTYDLRFAISDLKVQSRISKLESEPVDAERMPAEDVGGSGFLADRGAVAGAVVRGEDEAGAEGAAAEGRKAVGRERQRRTLGRGTERDAAEDSLGGGAGVLVASEGDDLTARERGAEVAEGKHTDVGVAPQEREGEGVADEDDWRVVHAAEDIRAPSFSGKPRCPRTSGPAATSRAGRRAGPDPRRTAPAPECRGA